jgi:hypothetical protein
MSPALAQFIIQACENADTFFEDEESMPTIRERYSYQYDKEPTAAIVCKSIMPVMAAVACEISAMDADDYWDNVDFDLEDIRHFQTDSLARSMVIY